MNKMNASYTITMYHIVNSKMRSVFSWFMRSAVPSVAHTDIENGSGRNRSVYSHNRRVWQRA